jgi:nucleoside-diphosphate-sugar epimerase
MKILLTGGNGFIGGHVRRTLIQAGHHVVTVSRSSTESTDVEAMLGAPSYVPAVSAFLPSCDAIVHLAACIDSDDRNPDLVSVNVGGAQQILELARSLQVRQVIYASSLPVIGIPQHLPITEEHPLNPLTVYHATKLAGEKILGVMRRDGISLASLRIMAPVGKGMPDKRLLTTLVRRALQGKTITLLGQGGRQQDYVDVRDIAQAVLACLNQKTDGTYNIGSGSPLSNKELAEQCLSILKSKSRIKFTGIDDAEDQVWDVSSTRAAEAFGYAPQHDMTSTIRWVAEKYAHLDD